MKSWDYHRSVNSSWGWSQSVRVLVVRLISGGFVDTPSLRVQLSPPRTAFPTDNIKRSSNLVETVFQVRLMAASQSADGDLVHLWRLQAIQRVAYFLAFSLQMLYRRLWAIGGFIVACCIAAFDESYWWSMPSGSTVVPSMNATSANTLPRNPEWLRHHVNVRWHPISVMEARASRMALTRVVRSWSLTADLAQHWDLLRYSSVESDPCGTPCFMVTVPLQLHKCHPGQSVGQPLLDPPHRVTWNSFMGHLHQQGIS